MIKVEHLSKNYGSICAVDDVSFSVSKGEVVGFLGPNGAGKSSVMNMLTGYLSSTAGTASVAGINILDNPIEAKKHIGYLPEQPPLYLDMTVEEYLTFAYNLKKCTLPFEAHINEICEVVKINDVYKRVIRNLSKGYRQRVGIAQALIGNPEIIIFDEPTVGLDPKQIIEIRNLIRTLGQNHTVVLSTHILQEVQAVCSRIIIINKGKIVADELTENITRAVANNRRFNIKVCGPQKEVLALLKSRPGVIYAEALAERDGEAYSYMVESDVGIDIRKNLFFSLAEKGWAMIGLEALGMNIEDIFITIVDSSNEIRARGVKPKQFKGKKNLAEKQLAREIFEKANEKSKSSEADKDAILTDLYSDKK